MKMKPHHFATLEECMLEARKADQRLDQALLEMEINPAYSNERIRWDWLWATHIEGVKAERWIVDNLSYLNDAHIDTALRRITGLV